MMDVVVTAMLVVVPTMLVSIWLVRCRQRYQWHKTIQVTLGLLLLAAVLAFEVEVRWTGWVERAQASPYWIEGKWNDWVDYSLALHLMFAIPTPLLWAFVIVQGLRKFPRPAAPCPYSQTHKWWARLAAAGMALTAITGWLFYWVAFVAS